MGATLEYDNMTDTDLAAPFLDSKLSDSILNLREDWGHSHTAEDLAGLR